MFTDRDQAGDLLADRLEAIALHDPVVLALPRGGVPVALPVARRLKAPLDLLMVRKLGLPGSPEVAGGAVVDGARKDVVFNTDILRYAGLTEADFDAQLSEKLAQIDARRQTYLAGRPPVEVTGRDVVVVDDGIATGATVRAALKALRRREPSRLLLAVPVAPMDSLETLRDQVDELICLETPYPFYAVGAHYRQFGQVGDDEVVHLLNMYWSEQENET